MGEHEPRLLHVVASFAPEAGGTTEAIRKLAQCSVGAVEVVCLDDPRADYVQGQNFPVNALGLSLDTEVAAMDGR
jgi:hypothetical protein